MEVAIQEELEKNQRTDSNNNVTKRKYRKRWKKKQKSIGKLRNMTQK